MTRARLVLRHLLVLACLLGATEVLWLFGTQSVIAEGRVTASFIHEAGGGRGGGGPVVLVSYEYVVAGSAYESTDVYQPRAPWGRKGWSAEERASAERFVAAHPSGTNVKVLTSEFFPWSGTLVQDSDATPFRGRGKPYWRWLAIAGGYAIFVFAKWLASGVKFRIRR